MSNWYSIKLGTVIPSQKRVVFGVSFLFESFQLMTRFESLRNRKRFDDMSSVWPFNQESISCAEAVWARKIRAKHRVTESSI